MRKQAMALNDLYMPLNPTNQPTNQKIVSSLKLYLTIIEIDNK